LGWGEYYVSGGIGLRDRMGPEDRVGPWEVGWDRKAGWGRGVEWGREGRMEPEGRVAEGMPGPLQPDQPVFDGVKDQAYPGCNV